MTDPDFIHQPTTTLISKAYAEQHHGDSAVSLPCALEQEFDGAVVARGPGFLLNKGIAGSGAPGPPSEPHPAKRPRSSMSPTIVVHSKLRMLMTNGTNGSLIIINV